MSEQLQIGFLSPKMILAVFTAMMIITYYDRGGLASALDTIQDQLHITNTQGGLLQSLFMVGYTISSPIFAQFGASFYPLKVMAVGLTIWAIAVTLCGLSTSFPILAFARALTGIGEASFLCLAPSFINLAAPPHQRSKWLSIFFTAIPVGYALGYVTGGILVGSSVLGRFTWRLFFITEALLMTPFIVISVLCKGPRSLNGNEENPKLYQKSIDDVKILLSDPVYMSIVLGYAAQTFVVGGFAFFGVKYAHEVLGYSIGTSGVLFGAVTLFAGIFGTAGGGILLDRLILTRCSPEDPMGSVEQALYTMLGPSLIGLPLCILSFNIPHDFVFFIVVAIGEFCLFFALSPTNSAVIWCVPLQLQPLAMALCVIFIHALGDAVSPVVIGALLDATHDWTFSMTIMASMLVPGILIWAVALFFVRRRRYSLVKDGSFAELDLGMSDRLLSVDLTKAGES